MAVRNSGVEPRLRFSTAAVLIGVVAILAFVVLPIRSRMGGAVTTVSPSLGASARSTNSDSASRASKADALETAKRRAGLMASYFEKNQGQSDPSVKYLSRSGRYSMFLTDDATTVISMIGGQIHKGPASAMTNQPSNPDQDRQVESDVRIRLAGANPHPAVAGLEPLPGRVNYLIGNDKSKWHTGIPTFGRVKFSNVYPGVDLVHYGVGDSLEYDLVVAPGADTSKIKLAVEGNARTVIDDDGNLQIITAAGVLLMRKPSVYQQNADGSQTPVDGGFVLAKDGTIENRIQRREVTFRIAAYDHSRELTIDPAMPILIYSSYLGGTASSTGPVNLEQFGSITAGNALTVADVGLDVALDSTNHAYVTGVAYSNNFPTTAGAFQTVLNGANSPTMQNENAFVAKFDTTMPNAASLVYATYLGGSGDKVAGDKGKGDGDLGFGIAVDAGDQAFIVGQTYSTDFPDTAACGAFGQTNNQGAASTNVGFISKLNAAGSALDWSCYIDGSENATESRVVLFPAGCGATVGTQCKAYMAGSTQSTIAQGFPGTPNRFQTDLRSPFGKSNATFIVVHEDGQSLDYATHYGGSGNMTNADAGIAVAVDSNGNGYITGATFSSDLTTTTGAAFTTYDGNVQSPNTSNAFVAEFNPNAAAGMAEINPNAVNAASLLYATYLGGTGAAATIVGITDPTVGDFGTGIVVDSNFDIWVAGATASLDFRKIPGNVGTSFLSFNRAGARTDCMPDSTANPPATSAFIVQLDPVHQMGSNQVRYSTYLSGCGVKVTGPIGGTIGFGEAPTGLQVVGSKVYLTGAATSGTHAGHDFPISSNAGACSSKYRLDDNQTTGLGFGGFNNILPLTAFATELDTSQASAGNEIVFSALLSGTGLADIAGGLALDSNGNMVIAGVTWSTDFPITPNAFQTTNRAHHNAVNSTNAFLTVINPAGSICPTPFPSATATATATGATVTATPTATPTATATATSTGGATVTATATATATKTATATATKTATATATSTGGATATATRTATPTATRTATATATATATGATATATVTATRTATATATRSATPTATATPGVGHIKVTPKKKLNLHALPNAMASGAITIDNTGNGPLTANVSPTTLNAPLSETGAAAGIVIPPMGSHDVIVTYSPTKKGRSKATVTITSDDPAHKRAIKILIQGTAK